MRRVLTQALVSLEKAVRGHARGCNCAECVEHQGALEVTSAVVEAASDGARELRRSLRRTKPAVEAPPAPPRAELARPPIVDAIVVRDEKGRVR